MCGVHLVGDCIGHYRAWVIGLGIRDLFYLVNTYIHMYVHMLLHWVRVESIYQLSIYLHTLLTLH